VNMHACTQCAHCGMCMHANITPAQHAHTCTCKCSDPYAHTHMLTHPTLPPMPHQKILEGALTLPGVRGDLAPEQRARLAAKGAEPTLHQRATIFLLLAEVTASAGSASDVEDAKRVGSDRGWIGLTAELACSVTSSSLTEALGCKRIPRRLSRFPVPDLHSSTSPLSHLQ